LTEAEGHFCCFKPFWYL